MPAVPIPAPDENSKAWDTLAFKQGKTDYTWPEDEEYGLVEWSSFKSSAKIDKKSKSGAAKPRVTQTGGEAVSFSFTLRIAYHIEEALTTVVPVLDKLRPGAGPYEFNHPWAAFDGIRGFMVESVERFPPEDGELRVTVECVEVNPDAQSGKGGNVTKTPTREEQYNRAQDEWLARARAAQAFQENENRQRAQDITDQAAANGDSVATRVPKKLHSVFVGEDEISASPAQPRQSEAQSNTGVATGSVNG